VFFLFFTFSTSIKYNIMTKQESHNNPENTGQNQVSTRGQNIVSSNSQNATEIVQNLDLIISQIGNQNAVVLSSSSNKNLEEEISENRLYKMSENERQQLAQNFTGLDRIMYDKLVGKTGTIQEHGGSLAAMGVISAIPLVGIIGSVGLPVDLKRAQTRLERSFSVEEVREIVNELGVGGVVEAANQLVIVKNEVIQLKNAFDVETKNKDEQIERLQGEVKEANEVLGERIEAKQAEYQQIYETKRQE
jgi:hypothetical protein